jgi:hypothetical protein
VWIASPGAGGPGGVHEVGAAHACGQRESSGQRLAQADEVGDHSRAFAGEPGSGAAEPGVDLVEDQQRPGFVRQPAKQREEAGGRNADATPGLDGFDQDGSRGSPAQEAPDDCLRGGEARGVFRGGGRRALGERDEAPELAQLIAERAAEMFAMGRVERAVTEPVIPALEREDSRASGGQTGGLQGGLDGFEPGTAEDHATAERGRGGGGRAGPALECQPAEFAGQPGLEGVGVDVAHGVEQATHLAACGGDHGRVGVAGGGDAEGGGEVEIATALGIPHPASAGAFPDDGPRPVGSDERDVARFVISQEGEGAAGVHRGAGFTGAGSGPGLPASYAPLVR